MLCLITALLATTLLAASPGASIASAARAEQSADVPPDESLTPIRPAERHLLLVAEIDADGARLLYARSVDLPLPAPVEGRWRVEVLGAADELLHAMSIRDPGLLRGEFHGAADGEPMDAVHIRPAKVSFALRLPLYPAATRIRLLAPAATLPEGDRRAAGADRDALVEVGTLAFPQVSP